MKLPPASLAAFAPGEALFHYLLRASGVLPTTNLRYANGALVSMLFPSAIQVNFNWLSNLLPLEDILKLHTHFPLFSAYVEPALREMLRKHYLWQSNPSIANMVGLPACGPRTGGRLKICLLCIEHGLRVYGVALLRREHLLPGLLHCPIHLARLVRFCEECYSGFSTSRAVRLISQTCRCGKPLETVGPSLEELPEAAMIAIAEDTAKVLDGALTNVSLEAMRRARKIRAQEMGLVSPGGVVNRDALDKAVERCGLTEVLRLLGFDTKTRNSFALCVCGKERSTPHYLANLAADILLFQGLDGLIQTVAVLEQGAAPNPVIERKLDRARRKILNAIESYPGITRAKIGNRVSTRDLKLVATYESDWYDAVLPKRAPRAQSSRAQYSTMIQERVNHAEDIRCKKHILFQRERLLSAPDLPPINQTRLLRGHPCASAFASIKHRRPLSARLISKLSETCEDHSLRRIRTWLPEIKSPHRLTHRKRKKLISAWRNRRDNDT